jgi:hypothetical protein
VKTLLATTIWLFVFGATSPVRGDDAPRDDLRQARQDLRTREREWAEVESALRSRLAADPAWVSAHARWEAAVASYTAQRDTVTREANDELARAVYELNKITTELSAKDANVAATRLRLFQAKRRVLLLARAAATTRSATTATTRGTETGSETETGSGTEP